MPVWDNVGGVYHKAKPYSNIGGVWVPDKKDSDNIAGVWRQGYSKAIEWTSAVNILEGSGYVGIRNDTGYSAAASIDSTDENMSKSAEIVYTFAEPLQMPEGSTLLLWASSVSYPKYCYVYVNGASVATISADGSQYISFAGNVNSVKIKCSFGNVRKYNSMFCKVTINPAGSNSFLLNNANSADL